MRRFLAGSIIASVMLFSGCTSGSVEEIETGINNQQPHAITRTITSTGTGVVSQNDEDIWQKFVTMSASFDHNDNNFILDIQCQKGISSDVAHFQIYLDVDNNAATGFTDSLGSDYAIIGADYMVEDGSLYKSSSASEWQWSYVDEIYYTEEETNSGVFKILLDDNGAAASMFNKNDLKEIRVSIEPTDAQWSDTGNFVQTQDIAMDIVDQEDAGEVNFSGAFAKIQELIYKAQNAEINNVTYISLGDSTRAIDNEYNGGGLFSAVQGLLRGYNVDAQLEAVAGHTLRRWNNYDGQGDINEPTWETTVAAIPGDGSTTIVNISLGINDARYYGDGGEKERIKFHMNQAIDKVLAVKPNTKFMLTMPEKLIGYDTKTAAIKAAYEEMSAERNIPLINTIDALFSGEDDLSLYRAADAQEYGEGFRIHLSSKGQALVSDLILSKILP